MKKIILNTLLIAISLFLLLNCRSITNKESLNKSEAKDSVELTNLIRNIYKWHETDSFKVDFKSISKDSIPTGIDWEIHKIRTEQLLKTNFFSKEFLHNYNCFASHLDSSMKKHINNSDFVLITKPIYECDDFWCNSAWKPEKYWETLTISDYKNFKDSATFKWTWGNNHFYSVKAKIESNIWKISYLEGFK